MAGERVPDLTLRVYSHLLERDLAEAAVKYDPLRDVMVDGGRRTARKPLS